VSSVRKHVLGSFNFVVTVDSRQPSMVAHVPREDTHPTVNSEKDKRVRGENAVRSRPRETRSSHKSSAPFLRLFSPTRVAHFDELWHRTNSEKCQWMQVSIQTSDGVQSPVGDPIPCREFPDNERNCSESSISHQSTNEMKQTSSLHLHRNARIESGAARNASSVSSRRCYTFFFLPLMISQEP
jgi:hypothetical protein